MQSATYALAANIQTGHRKKLDTRARRNIKWIKAKRACKKQRHARSKGTYYLHTRTRPNTVPFPSKL